MPDNNIGTHAGNGQDKSVTSLHDDPLKRTASTISDYDEDVRISTLDDDHLPARTGEILGVRKAVLFEQNRYASPKANKSPRSLQAIYNIRLHFIEKALKFIEDLSNCAGEPDAAIYVDGVLNILRRFNRSSEDDPMTDITYAFHDAIAHKNSWANYTKEQYLQAKDLLAQVSTHKSIDRKLVEKTIGKLEGIGFNTFPYEVDFDIDEDID